MIKALALNCKYKFFQLEEGIEHDKHDDLVDGTNEVIRHFRLSKMDDDITMEQLHDINEEYEKEGRGLNHQKMFEF